MEYRTRLLIGHRYLEHGFMSVGVEHLANRVDLLQSMLLQRAQQNALYHLQPIVEIHELLLVLGVSSALFGNSREGTVEVVDAVNKVFGELLNSVVLGSLLVTLGAVLEVTEVGDGAGEFILVPIESVRAQLI